MNHHKDRINMKDIYKLVLILLASSLLASSPAMAQDYYKWVDEQGVTHYSEMRPGEGVEHQTFILPDQYSAPSNNPEDDYYSIQNQLDRTLARNEKIAGLRAERVEEPSSQLSRVEVIDNRGGFFVPNGLQNLSPHYDANRFNGRQLQQQGGTRIGNQLRRQGIIPSTRQPQVQVHRQGERQSGFQRPGLGLISP